MASRTLSIVENNQINLTIITVNLNNADGLEKTAQSISRLTYQYYEWLIIDGASGDGFLSVIQKYNKFITKWLSEPDDGIYCAMNKGVRFATGNMLLFMNSGDIFLNENTLDFLSECKFSEREIIVGQSQFANSKIIYPSADDALYLNKKRYFCFQNGFIPHQATFIPRQLLLFDPYDESMKISSDLDFFLKMTLYKRVKVRFIKKLIAICDKNGISNHQQYRTIALQEDLKIRKKYFGFWYYYYKLHKKLNNLVKRTDTSFIKMVYKLLRVILVIFTRFSFFYKQNTLLIIRPDNIGDYILFRNFLLFINKSQKYRNMKITLMGNRAYKTLAEYFDSDFVSKFIWIDNKKFYKNNFPGFLHTLSTVCQLYKMKYHSIFYPVFSRTHFFDKLVNRLSSINKIACYGDLVNKKKGSLDITRQVYTEIIPTESTVGVFEFKRNKEIVEKFIDEKIEINYPIIDGLFEQSYYHLPDNYIVICMEANLMDKQWPDEYFEQVISYIVNNRNLSVVLLGLDKSVIFEGKQIIDLRGKTTLPEVASVLSKAKCFIGYDSGLMHLAIAVGIKKLVAICNGIYYGRFVPYPEISGRDLRFVFPPEISQNQHNPSYLREKYSDAHYENAMQIQPEQIIAIIGEIYC